MSKHRFAVAVAAAAVATALCSTPFAGAAPASYTDPSGDNGAAADVGAVTADLAKDGYITIKAAVANLPQPGQEGIMFLAFDTDRDNGTGSIFGGEYVAGLLFTDGAKLLLRWDGSEYVESGGAYSIVAGPGSVEVRIHPEALGGAKAFNFKLLVATGSPSAGTFDVAPDGSGAWFYEVEAPATVDAVDARFAPSAPLAGGVFRVPAVRLRLSDGSFVLPTSHRCVAKLGSATLRGSGKGGCTFAIPKTAKGKRLRVTLFVTYNGETGQAEPYVFKVR